MFAIRMISPLSHASARLAAARPIFKHVPGVGAPRSRAYSIARQCARAGVRVRACGGAGGRRHFWQQAGGASAAAPSASASASASSNDDDGEQATVVGPVIYEGPFGDVLKKIKLVSVFSCGCTLLGMPVVAVLGNQDIDLLWRCAIAFTVSSFAVGTTAALWWVTAPYITAIRLRRDPPASPGAKAVASMDVEQYSLFARKKTVNVRFGDIRPPGVRPFASFQALGKHYYIHVGSKGEPAAKFFQDERVFKRISRGVGGRVGESAA